MAGLYRLKMAMTDPKVVQIRELRFKPANSNDRARAGLEHDFKDVPPCSFAKDDGISPYMGSDSGISGFPDAPGKQAALLDMDIPPVKQEKAEAGHLLAYKLLRDGFGLSVFLHVLAVLLVVLYMAISLPDESVLNEGETVVAVEIYSETNSEVAAVKQQTEQEGEEIEEPAVEKAEVKPEPVKEPEKLEKPVEEKPVEQAKLPEVKEPEKVEEPVIVTDLPEVLASGQPSTFAVEQAAKQILETSEIKPLPDALPDVLVTPVPVEEKKPEPKLAQPLAHPVSKPRVVKKIAEAKPIEKSVEKKEEPKPVEKKPEPKKKELKKPEPKPRKQAAETPEKKPVKKKKVVQRDGNADDNSTKGRDTAKTKDGASQDASQGNSKKKLKGNAALTNYTGQVERKIDRAKKRAAVGAKGQAVVTFTINADGSVSNLRVKKSSGKPAIDKGALDVIRKSVPFPAIPSELDRKSLRYQKTIAFTGK